MRVPATVTRGWLLRASAVLLPMLVDPRASHAQGGVVEEVRKAASVVPGYGPSDLLFPPAFRGRWLVTRSVLDVAYPLGKERAPSAEAALAERQALRPITFDARFVETSDAAAFGASVIPDRAFNAVQRESALTGVSAEELEARWTASNPNVVTMRNRLSGSVVETKVTKRAVEAPQPGTFGTSEYARVADAGSSGVLGGVPRILATRERVRYRWDEASDGGTPARVDALAIENVFDPTQTGFADLAGATPVLTVKARLVYERRR
jgi:hypothetical protein